MGETLIPTFVSFVQSEAERLQTEKDKLRGRLHQILAEKKQGSDWGDLHPEELPTKLKLAMVEQNLTVAQNGLNLISRCEDRDGVCQMCGSSFVFSLMGFIQYLLNSSLLNADLPCACCPKGQQALILCERQQGASA
ncbi:MAG: hypothetical protein ABIG08_01150 [bacterium]